MTFSLLGADPGAAEIGIALASSSPAVAARCAHVRAGAGVAATQSITDPRLGPALLDALAAGGRPAATLRAVRARAPHAEFRQLAVLDGSGAGAAWSGPRTLGLHGDRPGERCVAVGNLLASGEVLDAMVRAFAAAAGGLADRLLAGVRAGLHAGGEAGPVRSAGLLVAAGVPWPVVDLRVDDAADPVGDLGALWRLYAPQRDDFVARALDPGSAPAFGVAGEEAVA